jgi:hypothetical protein
MSDTEKDKCKVIATISNFYGSQEVLTKYKEFEEGFEILTYFY